jgi:hypothetical protein
LVETLNPKWNDLRNDLFGERFAAFRAERE